MLRKLYGTLVSVALALTVGIGSALLTRGNMNIYETIATPPGAPPAWLFPIVWTLLYILMGVSAARVFMRKNPGDSGGLGLYILNLILNFGWSIVFFNFRAYLLAAVWIVALLIVIIGMTRAFMKVDKIAAYLQIPYILWVAYATYLTIGIAVLN